jgi:hypothetical protein
VLLGSPSWANSNPHHPPETSDTRRAFYRFAKAAVARYGPNGSFWAARPWATSSVRPLYWQVWNEENLTNYWGRADPTGYGVFARATSVAAKQADPTVKIVAGGLYTGGCTHGMCMEGFARRMLSVPGVPEALDAVAIHPYTDRGARGVLDWLNSLRRTVRETLGHSMPIVVTEFGWATGGHRFVVDYSTQARLLEETYQALLDNRNSYRLRGAFWFSLKDSGGSSWLYNTGVFDRYWRPKPAWYALARTTGGRP